MSSKAIVAGNNDYINAINNVNAYKVTVSSVSAGSTYTNTTVINGGCTITITEIVAASDYTVTVMGYSDTAATKQVALGTASSVAVTTGSTTPVTVTLSFTQSAAAGASNAGGFSLNIQWPLSTGLQYVYATLDGSTAVTVSSLSTSADPYTATLSASSLAGGVHTLDIYFKTSSSATVVVGPYIESVNIWDGVTDHMWADSSGALSGTLTLGSTEFASTDADLTGISVSGTPLSGFAKGTLNYNNTPSAAFTVTVTADSSGQSLSYSFNDTAGSWASVSGNTFTSASLTPGGANTVKITVTAADRKTTQTYCVTAGTLLTNSNISTYLNSTASTTKLNGNYVLAEDLALSSTSSLFGSYVYGNPSEYAFTGTFDGNGHTITLNLTSSNGAIPYCGVFPCNRGTIKNVHVAVTISQTGNDIAGGLVAVNDSAGYIYHCYTTGTITSETSVHGNFIGGLVGDNMGTIQECYSTVSISNTNTSVGGLVGSSMGGTIRDCYARGSVNGSQGIAGLSAAWPDTERYDGASPSSTTVTNCYCSGAVTPSGVNLGQASFAYYTSFYPPTMSHCFYDNTVDSSYTDGYATGESTSAMNTLATFSAWSISSTLGAATIWGIDTTGTINNGYPYLQYFGSNTVTP
jgi:hypothetical protein